MIVASIFLLAALGVGLLISTVARNQFVAAQSAIALRFYPPLFYRALSLKFRACPSHPMVYLCASSPLFCFFLQTLFLVGNVWTLIIPNCLAMLAIGSFYYFMAAHEIVKRVWIRRMMYESNFSTDS